MKKTLKLIPAIVMLLVSAILVSTASYAWFSMNTQVTATGMEIKAKTAASLAISADGTNYSDTMTLATNTEQLWPVTLVNTTGTPYAPIGVTSVSGNSPSSTGVTSLAFYKITTANKVNDPNSAAATHPIASAISGTTVDSTYFTVNTTDYVSDELWLKYTADTTDTANIDLVIHIPYQTISSTPTKLPIDKALHFAFVGDDGNVWNYDLSGFTEDDTNNAYTLSVATFVTLTGGTPVHYDVYAWYEGEDTQCTTNNAVKVADLVLDLTFTIHQD